jgi:hypothetical protein
MMEHLHDGIKNHPMEFPLTMDGEAALYTTSEAAAPMLKVPLAL